MAEYAVVLGVITIAVVVTSWACSAPPSMDMLNNVIASSSARALS